MLTAVDASDTLLRWGVSSNPAHIYREGGILADDSPFESNQGEVVVEQTTGRDCRMISTHAAKLRDQKSQSQTVSSLLQAGALADRGGGAGRWNPRQRNCREN